MNRKGAAAPIRVPRPFELMLSSLGACTAITLRMYSDRKQWKLGTIDVKLRLLKEGEEPLRIERKIAQSAKRWMPSSKRSCWK